MRKDGSLRAWRSQNARALGRPDWSFLTEVARTMTNYELHHKIANELDGLNDGRDVRALTEDMVVEPVRDREHRFRVASESGRVYTVDTQLGACTCPDHSQRDNFCKHARRVIFEEGMRPIPDGVVQIPAIADELTDEGESVDLELTLDMPEPTEPEPGADLDAERQMVEQQETTVAATDGGNADDADDEEICGAACKDGSPCEWPIDECPVDSHADRRGEALEDGTDAESDSQSVESDTDERVTSVGLAVADGGAGGDKHAFEARVENVVHSAIKAAGENATVVVVVNEE